MTSDARSTSPVQVENMAARRQAKKNHVTKQLKPRLTDHEKKINHIFSEQKRRNAIRAGFCRLTELVPDLKGKERSEGLVLRRTIDFMMEQLRERRRLVEELEARGMPVEHAMKLPLIQLQQAEADMEARLRSRQENGSGDETGDESGNENGEKSGGDCSQ